MLTLGQPITASLTYLSSFLGQTTFLETPTASLPILDENDYLQFENVLYRYEHIPGQGSVADPDQWVNNNQRLVDMVVYKTEPQAEFGGRSYYKFMALRVMP